MWVNNGKYAVQKEDLVCGILWFWAQSPFFSQVVFSTFPQRLGCCVGRSNFFRDATLSSKDENPMIKIKRYHKISKTPVGTFNPKWAWVDFSKQ
jgi:hypothetical protein